MAPSSLRRGEEPLNSWLVHISSVLPNQGARGILEDGAESGGRHARPGREWGKVKTTVANRVRGSRMSFLSKETREERIRRSPSRQPVLDESKRDDAGLVAQHKPSPVRYQGGGGESDIPGN